MSQYEIKKLINQNFLILENALKEVKFSISKSTTFFDLLSLIVKNKGNLVFSGVGKSGYALKKITASFNSYGISSHYIDANEAFHGDLGAISPTSIVVLASYSGETEEVIRLNSYLISKEINPFVITSNPKSKICKNTSRLIFIPNLKEICTMGLAPTTSYFSLVTTLEILFSLTGYLIDIKSNYFKSNHPSGLIGKKLNLRVDELMFKDKNIPTVREESSVFGALIEMNSKSLGIVCIIDNQNKIKGVFTDGDLRRFFSNKLNPYKTFISSFMTKKPIFAYSGSLATEALKILTVNKINTLPIVDSNCVLVGVLRLIDLYDHGFNYEQN